jgi:hypothetical protein
MPFFYFDLETGGLHPESSILEFGYALGGNQPESLFAEPEIGSRLYKWPETNIWSRVQQKQLGSEKEQLRKFLSVLGEQPEDTTLVGWNTGLRTHPKVEYGFDIPKLYERAKHFGLSEEAKKVLPRFQVRDVGKEFSVLVARQAVADKTTDKWFRRISWGYLKSGEIAWSGQEYIPTESAAQQVEGRYMKGWTLSQMYYLATGERVSSSEIHQAGKDIEMTRRLHQYLLDNPLPTHKFDPERFKEVVRESRKERLVSSLLHMQGTPQKINRRYKKILSIAEKEGFSDVEQIFQQRLKEQGGSFEDLLAGRGSAETYRRYTRTTAVPGEMGKVINLAAAKTWDFIRRHPKTSIGAGLIGAAYFLQAGSLFSGKDDEYNTIEGMGHGGVLNTGLHQASKTRPNYGFGSGNLRKILNKVVAFPGQVKRTVQTLGWLNKESNRAVAKITEEVVHGVKQGKPLELTVAGATLAEGAHVVEAAIGGTLGPGMLAASTATFFGTKYAYEIIKQRNAIRQLIALYKHDPVTSRMVIGTGKDIVSDQLKAFILRGQRNPLSTYIRSGGGEYGKQALLAHLEGMQFSGKDDVHNTIEGLLHGGLAEKLRKEITDFGSGWDALRGLVRAGETFTEMLGSREFQAALRNASEVKVIGSGAYGVVKQMSTTFRDKEFQFARKIGNISEREVATLSELQNKGFAYSPSVYRTRITTSDASELDMELFVGKNLEDYQEANQSLVEHFYKAFGDLHQRNIEHRDIALRNMMAVETPEGLQPGIVDYGFAAKKEEIVDVFQQQEFGQAEMRQVKSLLRSHRMADATRNTQAVLSRAVSSGRNHAR